MLVDIDVVPAIVVTEVCKQVRQSEGIWIDFFMGLLTSVSVVVVTVVDVEDSVRVEVDAVTIVVDVIVVVGRLRVFVAVRVLVAVFAHGVYFVLHFVLHGP